MKKFDQRDTEEAIQYEKRTDSRKDDTESSKNHAEDTTPHVLTKTGDNNSGIYIILQKFSN